MVVPVVVPAVLVLVVPAEWCGSEGGRRICTLSYMIFHKFQVLSCDPVSVSIRSKPRQIPHLVSAACRPVKHPVYTNRVQGEPSGVCVREVTDTFVAASIRFCVCHSKLGVEK